MASVRYIVNDVERSVDFYRDRLGFSVDMHNPGKFAALTLEDLHLFQIPLEPFPKLETKYLTSTTSLILKLYSKNYLKRRPASRRTSCTASILPIIQLH